jgi:hypothetical protein
MLYDDVCQADMVPTDGAKAGSYGAEAIRSISLHPRTLGLDVTYRY